MAVPVVYGVQRLIAAKLSWRDLAFLAPVAGLMAQSLVFARTQSWPYFSSVYGRAIDQVLRAPLLLVAGVGVLCAVGVMLVRCFGTGGDGRSAEVQTRLAWGWDVGMRILAVAVVLAALYAYFVRPSLADTTASWYYWYGDHEVPDVEPYNLLRLGWYLTPLGLVLAVIGAWLVLRRPVGPSVGLLMGIGLFFSVLFIANTRNNPHHIYVMRRYVPAVVPFLVTMMSVSLDALYRKGRPLRVAGVGLTAILAAWLLGSAWLQVIHIEYDGLIGQLDALVGDLGPQPAVILFNDDVAVGSGAFLGTPLNYLYGYSVFDLQEENVDAEALAEQVERWRVEGSRVLLADGPNAVTEVFSRLERVPLTNCRITYPVLEASYEHRPREILDLMLEVKFYEAVGTR